MDSPSGEKFCLKWNDFDNNLRSSFQQFREDKDFFDVSLVCEDEQIEAHKTILSACSVFFKKLFKRHQHHHPLVYLKGVKFVELTQLLQFVYQGEVNVAREDLSSFLEAAEELKIHGLTQDLTNETKPKSKPKSKPEKKSAPPRPRLPPLPRLPSPRLSWTRTCWCRPPPGLATCSRRRMMTLPRSPPGMIRSDSGSGEPTQNSTSPILRTCQMTATY